jgi:hypothetical protein
MLVDEKALGRSDMLSYHLTYIAHHLLGLIYAPNYLIDQSSFIRHELTAQRNAQPHTM